MAQSGDGFERVVQAAVQREMDVIGDQRAVEIAREVDGLDVDDTGAVRSLERSGAEVLADLVDRYKDASGEVAAFVIARRLENVVDDPDDLPENVRRHL